MRLSAITHDWADAPGVPSDDGLARFRAESARLRDLQVAISGASDEGGNE